MSRKGVRRFLFSEGTYKVTLLKLTTITLLLDTLDLLKPFLEIEVASFARNALHHLKVRPLLSSVPDQKAVTDHPLL